MAAAGGDAAGYPVPPRHNTAVPEEPDGEIAGGPTSTSPPQPEFDFDGRYHIERVGGTWCLRGPLFGPSGMGIGGDGPELLAKYRDLADLLNAAVDAERRRRDGR